MMTTRKPSSMFQSDGKEGKIQRSYTGLFLLSDNNNSLVQMNTASASVQ